jgi:hypothetical protein
MTTLTDPVHVQAPAPTPIQPVALVVPPAATENPGRTPRRSRTFTVRTSTEATSYRSWERAIGAARSLAAQSGAATSMTDEFSGSRFDVTTGGHVSPSPL